MRDCMSWLITLPTCLSSVQVSDYFRESVWGKSASDICSKVVVGYGRLAEDLTGLLIEIISSFLVFSSQVESLTCSVNPC